MGMKVGYARVGTTGQKLDVQMDRRADCDRVYHEKMSARLRSVKNGFQSAGAWLSIGCHADIA